MVSPPSIVRSTISDAVEGAVLRALSKVPADRYATTALFAEALNTPSAATGAHRRATLERGVRRPHRGVWRIASVAVALAALAAYFAIRSGRAGRGTAVGGLDPRHVAVLYFEDLSAKRDLAYLADGLTDALIDELARVPGLTVVSKNGVAPYRSPDIPRDSIARVLDAGTLVQGTVEDVGARYRVTTRLIEGASGADFRRASFEQPKGNLLAMRDTLAGKVAEFLRERLGEEGRLREERTEASNAAAWAAVEPDAAGAERLLAMARTDLEDSTRLNPNQVIAWTVLSRLYYDEEDLVAANRAARAAYDGDAYLAGVDVILYRLYATSYDLELFQPAIDWCDKGRRRFPSDARFVECQLLLLSTKAKDPDVAQAWRLAAEAVQLSPERDRALKRLYEQVWVAAVLGRAGLKDSARRVLQRSRGSPDIDPEREILGFQAAVYTMLADKEAALRLLSEYLVANPRHREGFRKNVHWWWRSLQEEPRFKALIGAR